MANPEGMANPEHQEVPKAAEEGENPVDINAESAADIIQRAENIKGRIIESKNRLSEMTVDGEEGVEATAKVLREEIAELQAQLDEELAGVSFDGLDPDAGVELLGQLDNLKEGMGSEEKHQEVQDDELTEVPDSDFSEVGDNEVTEVPIEVEDSEVTVIDTDGSEMNLETAEALQSLNEMIAKDADVDAAIARIDSGEAFGEFNQEALNNEIAETTGEANDLVASLLDDYENKGGRQRFDALAKGDPEGSDALIADILEEYHHDGGKENFDKLAEQRTLDAEQRASDQETALAESDFFDSGLEADFFEKGDNLTPDEFMKEAGTTWDEVIAETAPTEKELLTSKAAEAGLLKQKMKLIERQMEETGISKEEIDTYSANGVGFLKGLFNPGLKVRISAYKKNAEAFSAAAEEAAELDMRVNHPDDYKQRMSRRAMRAVTRRASQTISSRGKSHPKNLMQK